MAGRVLGVCPESTLLGPEDSVTFLRCGPDAHVPRFGVCGVWVRSLFENFTVDASIFVDQFFCLDVFVLDIFDKLLSAVGGCLGTKSR